MGEPFVMRLNMRAETKRGIERANMCYRCWSDKKEFKIFFKSQDGGSAVTSHMRKHEPGYKSESHKRKLQQNGLINGESSAKANKFEMDFLNWKGSVAKNYGLPTLSPLTNGPS